MASLSLLTVLRSEEFISLVDLFNLAGSSISKSSKNDQRNEAQQSLVNGINAHKAPKSKQHVTSIIVDTECCLDRLYGGFYSDWASGGQWNRMLSYFGNLSKACQLHNIQLIVTMRGGVETQHAKELFKRNRDFKERLNRVMMHLQNRGTPPPKVWWLPPTCLREVIRLASEYFCKLCFYHSSIVVVKVKYDSRDRTIWVLSCRHSGVQHYWRLLSRGYGLCSCQ